MTYSELLHKIPFEVVVAGRWEGTSPDIDMICTVRDRYDKS